MTRLGFVLPPTIWSAAVAKAVNGKAMRAKGDRFEREVVAACLTAGVEAQRVPLSGAAGGLFSGDVQIEMAGRRRKLECKVRARAWLDLYGWLVGNFALVIKRDREEPLVVMRLSDFLDLTKEPW